MFRTAKVVRGPITAAVSASGALNPVTSVLVGSQVSGQLKEVLVDFQRYQTRKIMKSSDALVAPGSEGAPSVPGAPAGTAS